MRILLFFLLLAIVNFSFIANALPKYKIDYGNNALGIVRIKLTNETTETLACYIAIDGFKKKFVLPPFKASKWYSATDPTFTHSNFSTWCDLLEFYPNYKKYRQI